MFRRNEHCKVCFAAGAWESGTDISLLTVRAFDAQDKHVLCHPAFFLAQPRTYTQCKAFFAQQNISAISGVDAPYGIVFREVGYVFVFGIYLGFGVEALYKVGAFVQFFDYHITYTCHDMH